ncbi:MAG TPA: hypothetical protein DCP31_36375 [Cyanobacteria bacterium UBA8543]|nr:hypothetical protein [Cyanobacteria bacterium UBA8543]
MPYIITEIPQSEGENSDLDDVITALDYLNELTELRELLEMCLEENTDSEGNTQNIRIRLLIDCYLSRSEYCVDEFRAVLEQLKSLVKMN